MRQICHKTQICHDVLLFHVAFVYINTTIVAFQEIKISPNHVDKTLSAAAVYCLQIHLP